MGKKKKSLDPSKDSPLYKVKSIASLNGDFLKKVVWPDKAPSILVDFPPVQLKKGRFPNPRLGRGYKVHFNFYSAKAKKTVPSPIPAKTGISAREPASLAEARRVSRAAFNSYVRRFADKLYPGFREGQPIYEKEYLPKSKSLIVFKGPKPCGFFSLYPYKRRTGEKCEHMTWCDIFAPLSSSEKNCAKGLVAEWIRRVLKKNLSVGLESHEKEWVGFFEQFGMATTRAVVYRKK
jgi:hypothetical protein